MSGFTDILNNIATSNQALPYMLINTGALDGGASKIPKQIFLELESLFAGNLANELADVGPYLGRLKSIDSITIQIVEKLLINRMAILVQPKQIVAPKNPIGFIQIHRHFRKLNVVTGPNRENMFFRYYDARIIESALQIFTELQLIEFFEVVNSIVLSTSEENPMIFTFKDKTLSIEYLN